MLLLHLINVSKYSGIVLEYLYFGILAIFFKYLALIRREIANVKMDYQIYAENVDCFFTLSFAF